jgi:endoglucanase
MRTSATAAWEWIFPPLPARNAVEQHGFLNVKTNRIVGETGQAAMLRGMSLFWSQWQPDYFAAETLRWLKVDWRISVIRVPLGVHDQGYLENPAAEMAKIERVIEAAIALGIYVVVDWHAHHPEPGPAGRFFSQIARRYGKHPNLIYEPWNEPAGHYGWADIKSYHARMIEEIRAHDSRNLIVAGTQNWCRDVDVAANDPLPFPNIAYSLHFYAASHRRALRDKAERAMRVGAALMVTEWGTCQEDGNGPLDAPEVKRWWAFLEKHGISHINWSVSDRAETSAALIPGAGRGAWERSNVSRSGHLVRRQLRRAGRLFG